MAWESNGGQDQDEAGRDWSKLMWYGLALVLAIMVILLYIPKERPVLQTRARVWHILVQYDSSQPGEREAALKTVSDLRERIIAGESFSKLAKEYSSDPGSAQRSGDLGWVTKGTLAASVEAAVWELPLNQVSGVIETAFGVHLVLVSDREITDADAYQRELHDRVIEESTGGPDR